MVLTSEVAWILRGIFVRYPADFSIQEYCNTGSLSGDADGALPTQTLMKRK